ncbi:Arsenite methyltransferase, partial [Kickxella alabastrina]
KVPDAVNDKFYGCGNPIPLGISGKDVLDLGSGSGRDCYVAAALVGPQGSVTGIDMTDEQLQTARENIDAFGQTLGYQPNLKFLTGYIEMLQAAGVAKESKDICISNCVINLSPNKRLVLEGVYQALRSGGELYFSDVYADAQLSDEARAHDVLLGECIGGALFTEEFEQIAHDIGFATPRVLAISHIEVHDEKLKALVNDTKFFSITYRLFKTPQGDIHPRGNALVSVTYNGAIEGHEEEYVLDVNNVFKRNVPTVVGAETACVLSLSWLEKYFTFDYDFEVKQDGAAEKMNVPGEVASTLVLMQKAYEESIESEPSAGCCPPKAKSSGCCPPKAKSSDCCPPKPASDNASAGSCLPKIKPSGCCPPKPITADTPKAESTGKLEILNASSKD